MNDETLGLVIMVVFSLVAAWGLYISWVKPRIAASIRAKYPFEPGADRDVSRREMYVRSAWRYDDWLDRILSLILSIMLLGGWFLVFTGH